MTAKRILGTLVVSLAVQVAAAEREVAVTFDDLPGPTAGLTGPDVATLRDATQQLLAAIRAHAIPVVGFVNEGKLSVSGETPQQAQEREAVLKLWVDAGLELGNHTYSHDSLNRRPLAAFQDDVVKGEEVTRRLLASKGARLRYFRHPFLHVGLDLETRRAFEAFLKERGYTIAPVTYDAEDYVFAFLYADARRTADAPLARRLIDAYVAHNDTALDFSEAVAKKLFGREIPQVMLVHANALNAATFERVAARLRARGYRFVTLDKALADPAYARADTYVGPHGPSWLTHWEKTDGVPVSPAPDPPDWVMKAYRALEAARRP